MPVPGYRSRNQYILLFLFISVASLCLVPPVAASLYLTGESFTPAPPLVVGQIVNATNTIAIVPVGKTTFPSGHTLQMQTSLIHAQWNIQIFVNGRAAAHQSAYGSAAFIVGDLLSYSMSDDTSFQVAIDGTVPVSSGSVVQVLLIKELDNSGAVVPGSIISVTPAVANLQTTTVPPSSQITSVAPVPSATKQASGFSAVGICAALGICLAFLKR